MRTFLDECDYLIHLIRCAIHGLQPQELPEGLDFQRVYEYGVYHHVANIAFYSVEKLVKKPMDELYRQWSVCRDKAVVCDINHSFAAEEIRIALENANIRWLEVQGAKIKEFYPQSDWRTMSDLDFIVDPENLPEVAQLLQALGYDCRCYDGVEVDAYRSPNVNVEMHASYFPVTMDYHRAMRPPFASVEETGEYDLNEFYLYNILHIAKHYYSGGCGIRRVLDVYFLNINFAQRIDRDYIKTALERVNAADFAEQLSVLANGWFAEEEQNVPRSQMASYIVQSGLHGHRRNKLKNRVKKNLDGAGRLAKLKYILRRFFGTGEILRKNYPILEHRKFLYPFCWLHRAFCALQPQKMKRLRKEVKAVKDMKATDK